MRLPFAYMLFRRRSVVPLGIDLCFGCAGLAFGNLILFPSLASLNQLFCKRLLNFRVRELRMMDFLRLGDLADEC